MARTIIRRMFTAALMSLFIITPTFGQQISEYQVKAAFLLNFTRFIEWPATSFNTPNDPFIIGIVGTDPFGVYLREITSGEKVSEHAISLKAHDSLQNLDRCQILYINMPENTVDALNKVRGRPVLTVSDAHGFVEKGGMIQFYTENQTIRLKVNINALRSANLNVSSKLLRISKIYEN